MRQPVATDLLRSVKSARATRAAVRAFLGAAHVAARTRAAVSGYAYSRAWRQHPDPGTTGQSHSAAGETGATNPLGEFFAARTVGRGIVKWHHYFEIYHRHLAKFVGAPSTLLEIGIYAGGGLDMWRDYLGSRCELYGVDIDPSCTRFEEATIFIGDQADRAFWKRFRAEAPSLDIIIDDGGHTVLQQLVTLEELLPHLRPGGVYICEDIHGDGNGFLGYAYGLLRGLFTYDLTLDESNPARVLSSPATMFQSAIHSVHLYPYVLVIERRDTPLAEFVASKRGTEWPRDVGEPPLR